MGLEIRTKNIDFHRGHVKRLEATIKDSDIGSFTLELYELDYNQLSLFPRGHTIDSILEIYRDGENVFGEGFGFFIEDVKLLGKGGAVLSGRSYESLLEDERIIRMGTNGGDILTLMKYMLAASSKVVYKDSNFDDPGDTVSKTFGGETYIELLRELTVLTGGWFYVRRLGDDFHGFVKNERGGGSLSKPVKILNVGREVSVSAFSYGTDVYRIINRQKVTGRQGSNVDETYNNTNSQTKYGIFEGEPIYDENISTTAQASNLATLIFASFADPVGDAEVKTIEYVENVHVGDYVGIALNTFALSIVMQPVEITLKFKAGKMDMMDIDFDYPTKRLERMLKAAHSTARRAGTKYMSGKEYEPYGTYFIDTGWTDTNVQGSARGAQIATCTPVGGDCLVGANLYWIDITIPEEFTTADIYVRHIIRTQTGTTYSTCYKAECATCPEEIWCGRLDADGDGEDTILDDLAASYTISGDHSGHMISVGFSDYSRPEAKQRFIVGWDV